MALWTDVIQPANVTAFARTAAEGLDLRAGTLSDVFPNINPGGTTYSWTVGAVLDEVAEYRAFDAESSFGQSKGSSRKTTELLPVSLKKRLSEYDQYILAGANAPETLVTASERIAGELAEAQVNRQALLRGASLVSGRLTINDAEGDVLVDVDFGRRADFTKTAATLWGTAGADPIADLETWLAQYEEVNGRTPTHLILSRRVLSVARVRLIEAGYFGKTEAVNVTTDMINTQLVDRGLPAVSINERRAAGQRVIPDNRVILASNEGAGGTVWGTTIEAADPRYGLSSAGLEVPGLVVGAYRTEDPQVAFIRSNAVALPVLANPDLTISATVL